MFRYNGNLYPTFEAAMSVLMNRHPFAGDDDLVELGEMYIEDADETDEEREGWNEPTFTVRESPNGLVNFSIDRFC